MNTRWMAKRLFGQSDWFHIDIVGEAIAGVHGLKAIYE